MTCHFRLERTDGTLADPPTLSSSASRWRQGDEVPLGAGRALRVLGIRDVDADRPPVLVVDEVSRAATSDAA
jgi:hypothetical protein